MAFNDNDIFTPNQYENIYYEAPIVAKRAPTVRDKYEIGKVWIDKTNNDAYFITSITSGSAIWVNAGGGSGVFASLTAETGDITATLGNIVATAGNLNIAAGTVTFGALGAGTLRSSAAGVVSSLADGADGTVLIGTTGGAPAWATLTAGAGITIAEAAGSITISNPGATGTTFGTDVGGPVSPTGGGLTTFEGYDTNITTDGATANTVKIRLADDIVSVASITATNDLTMAAGTCTITSDDNSSDAIYLHANAGVNEQIHIRANQGTAANSVILSSDAGGLLISGGLASVDAVNIQATNAAGGIDVDYGTGGMSIIGANGGFTVESGTAAISIGADAAAHDVTLGSTNTTASLTLQSGTGDVNMTSTDKINLDAVGTLELNSSAGIIGIGNDAVAQNINIGTGAAARTITVGNSSGASQVIVDCGTGGASFGASANAHTTTIGSTNTTSDTTIQAGSGAMTFTAGGAFDVNAVGAVTIDSSTAAISIGADDVDQAVNISTDGERACTVGSINGAASVIVDCGTGGASFGASATAHTTTIGSTNTTSNLVLQTGTGSCLGTFGGILDLNVAGDITIDGAASIFDLSVTGNITIDSSAGTIGIGVDDIDQAINIATAGERVVTIGNQVGVAGIVVESGSAGMQLNGLGLTSVECLTDTQAAASVTVNGNNGAGIFTGITTAAAGTQQYTITNSVCTVNSRILVTVANKGANDAKITMERVTPLAGSFTVDCKNNGTQAQNGDTIITFWILTA